MAFSLVVLAGAELGREIELTPPEVLIGSAPVCQIVLSAPTVSRVHCKLATDGSSVRVHDQASTNGTLINGRVVDGQANLVHGDVLRVGPFEFRARFDDPQSILGREPRTADIAGDTAELYQRALEHDEEAARQLYYRFLPRVTRFAEKSLGTQLKRVLVAEDVAQEVLVDALIEVAAYDFRRRGSFMAFLRHKLRNVICDHSRYWSAQKRGSDRTVALDAAGTGATHRTAPTTECCVPKRS